MNFFDISFEGIALFFTVQVIVYVLWYRILRYVKSMESKQQSYVFAFITLHTVIAVMMLIFAIRDKSFLSGYNIGGLDIPGYMIFPVIILIIAFRVIPVLKSMVIKKTKTLFHYQDD